MSDREKTPSVDHADVPAPAPTEYTRKSPEAETPAPRETDTSQAPDRPER